MSTRLDVRKVSHGTNELQLRDLFSQAGTVVEVKVVVDREAGRPRGLGFVEMGSPAEAARRSNRSTGTNSATAPLR
jgi:cold-inducible RNA-binding protein